MMNLTLTTEDPQEMKVAIQANSLLYSLWDMDQKLRRVAKDTNSEVEENHADRWRQELHAIMNDHGVDLNELVN